jgi:cysteinyl-tRNA synthetase
MERLSVRMVSNITDIDDKIIDRAQAEARPWNEITNKCERVWFDAMGKLDVLRPTEVPHATDYVEQMVAMIGELMDTRCRIRNIRWCLSVGGNGSRLWVASSSES